MELQIIRAQEFIRLGAHGHFDLKASRAVLATLAGACLKRGIHQALLDLRALHPGPKPVFSPGDLVTLVNTFRQIGFTHRQRLGVLYRFDPHHRASMFASIARLRGWSVKALDDFEDAVTWLARAEQEASEVETDSTTRARRVPVRQLKHLEVSSNAKPAARLTIQVKSAPGPKPDATQPRIRKDQGASACATLASPLAWCERTDARNKNTTMKTMRSQDLMAAALCQRSADFQSAVSPTCSRHTVGESCGARGSRRLRIGNQHEERLEARIHVREVRSDINQHK